MEEKTPKLPAPPAPPDLPDELLDVWINVPWDKISEQEKTSLLMPSDPYYRDLLLRTHWIKRPTDDESAKEQAKEIHGAIMPAGQPRPEQMRFSFSPFPTQLSRTSPFFPLSTIEIGHREYIRDMEIASHAWGSLTYSGPKLSVYDEDYLMILLALLCDANSRIEESGEQGATYTYVGNVRQILKLKGIENPGAKYYKTVIEAYTLMAGASFSLTTRKHGKGGTAKDTSYVNNIITNIVYKHGSGNIRVTVNPYFYQAYANGFVTWLDVKIRARLKSPSAKAMYRFIMSQRDDHWEGPLLTLASSTNTDLGLPKIKIRERLKKAISELVSVGVLQKKSCIKKDVIDLWRVPRQTPQKKIS